MARSCGIPPVAYTCGIKNGGATSAFDAALLDASDRIADAIDSVLHVLAQPHAETAGARLREALAPSSARDRLHDTP